MIIYTLKKSIDNSKGNIQYFHSLVILSKLVYITHNDSRTKKKLCMRYSIQEPFTDFLLVSFSIISEKYMFYLFKIKRTLHPKFYHYRAPSNYMENLVISHMEVSSHIACLISLNPLNNLIQVNVTQLPSNFLLYC